MPTYHWDCPTCGVVIEASRLMANRDDPMTCVCGAMMARSMVYAFRTATNEASQWPYDSDALLPSGKRYEDLKARGCIVSDGHGGERVRVEDAKMYKTLCKEQGVKPLDENEKITRSQHRPYKKARKDRMDKRVTRAVEGARKALEKKGIKV